MALNPEIEFEGLYRTHDLDDAKFIAWVKKTIKSKTIRVNRYVIFPIIDGTMLRLEVEKYIKGKSAGTRVVKGYLSETKFKELEKLLDAIPKKSIQDTRSGEYIEYPIKLEKGKANLKEMDLDHLFDD